MISQRCSLHQALARFSRRGSMHLETCLIVWLSLSISCFLKQGRDWPSYVGFLLYKVSGKPLSFEETLLKNKCNFVTFHCIFFFSLLFYFFHYKSLLFCRYWSTAPLVVTDKKCSSKKNVSIIIISRHCESAHLLALQLSRSNWQFSPLNAMLTLYRTIWSYSQKNTL